MNKRKIRNLFLILIALFLLPNIKVEAASTCTTQEKNNLLQLAYNIKFDYELDNSRMGDSLARYYKITVSNIPEQLYIKYDYSEYKYDKNSETPGIIKIQRMFDTDSTVEFQVFATGQKCNNVFITKRTVRLPHYNVYTECDECQQYPDFKLCDKNYSGEITPQIFSRELEKYKKSIEKKEKKETKQEKKENIIEKITKLYMKNLVISITITAIVLFVIGFGIYKTIKRQKQIKIKL